MVVEKTFGSIRWGINDTRFKKLVSKGNKENGAGNSFHSAHPISPLARKYIRFGNFRKECRLCFTECVSAGLTRKSMTRIPSRDSFSTDSKSSKGEMAIWHFEPRRSKKSKHTKETRHDAVMALESKAFLAEPRRGRTGSSLDKTGSAVAV